MAKTSERFVAARAARELRENSPFPYPVFDTRWRRLIAGFASYAQAATFARVCNNLAGRYEPLNKIALCREARRRGKRSVNALTKRELINWLVEKESRHAQA